LHSLQAPSVPPIAIALARPRLQLLAEHFRAVEVLERDAQRFPRCRPRYTLLAAGRLGPGYPLMHITCFSVCTTSIRSDWLAITTSISL